MENKNKTTLPNLPLSTIWMLSFGFLGVQMAFSLQSSQMGRIFQTLGADPTKLGFFFILPPLAGMVVQPIVGYLSDRTWSKRFGRRMPYLLVGALVSVIVMFLLPNSGSFGFKTSTALWFGAIAILFMDLSSNVAMQPFKMVVGDMVNEKQKSYAYSIQSFLSNTGSVLATIFPYLLTAIGVANTAAAGQVPDSVRISFYVGAVILVIFSLISVFSVHEYDDDTYKKYHGVALNEDNANEKNKSMLQLLKEAPKTFWSVTLTQFFCWMAFQYLWTYGAGSVAATVYHAADPTSSGYQAGANWFGILSAVYAVAAVIWSLVLSKIPAGKNKLGYTLSLFLGAIGFISVFFIHSQFGLLFSFILIGISWAGMMAYPFIMVTNALDGYSHMGTYLGLFNGSICLPQIVASVASFAIFPAVGSKFPAMILISGILMLIGSLSVSLIKEKI
ncbi:MAG: SLC45 family MFS transporter [Liquorilactobacillus nagelii]|jgi:maltose/moltooligosaccharide transporter|uniref:MFS transporter n=1 Tax=Liquorilactobacillus nagelii TaxID=82688 RepID=A0A3Q8D0V7_9LACO|nr:SLC45 family MFS transporter [Liquorilactobacillus nagelii]AUJ32656.1 MFS transporter [Liquorilactobacillus nagelii]KRL42382.1 major facilitator superfamily permease [Liquorilactobacillus nagelii DSM 13675]MCC7617219.1 MFS transporter [Liquorilactobacillus nagelii]MCP9315732.1 SLC45 family MFS transporter [Liquorilactobacillus nagelii]QYH53236.1 SLC45 family MFS transporter [Liquorilactobacillus nagelii DSM 13675]